MRSIAEQQQEYLARPDVRTMPLSQAELKEAEDFDVDWQAGRITGAPPIISPNPDLLIKFFMLGNYIVCRDGFLTAIQTLRPIFSQVPGPVEESKPYNPDNDYLKLHGLQHVAQRHAVAAENEKQADSAADRMQKLAREGARKLDFQSKMFGIEKVRVNAPGMVGYISWSATHRERVRLYESLRGEFPEFVKYIDQAIAKEKAA